MTLITAPLRRMGRIINGGTPTPDTDNWDGPVPWATPVDLAAVDGGVLSGTGRTLTQKGLASGSSLAPAGSILLSTRAPIGYTALALEEVAFNQGCKAFVPRKGLSGKFIQYVLISKKAYLQAQGSGSTFLELANESLAQVRVPVVSYDQQRRIADFLDDRVARIDQIIAARQAEQQLIELHRRAKLGVAILEASERTVQLRQIADVRLGRQRSPENDEGDHMVSYLRSANVVDGEILLEDVKQMNFTPAEQSVFRLKVGDVLVSEGSASPEAVGAAATWRGELPGPICFQNTLLRIRARDRYDQEFLGYWARAAHALGAPKNFATGATILHLGAEGLGKMAVPLISVSEQHARAITAEKTLAEHQSAKLLLQHQIAHLQEYKQSLITAAVTGEFDVTTASTRIPE